VVKPIEAPTISDLLIVVKPTEAPTISDLPIVVFPAGRGLYLCWEAKEKRPLPRSDTSSVHDRGRVKPVCKTSSETGLEKQIVRMLRAELR
jgi:hypothetical protein